jgi:hypothetical protein
MFDPSPEHQMHSPPQSAHPRRDKDLNRWGASETPEAELDRGEVLVVDR